MSTTVQDLAGAAALVVGGTGRIGSAVCRRLAARGAFVVVHYRGAPARARDLVDEVGGPGAAMAVHADLDRPGAAGGLVAAAAAGPGRLDVLVSTAHPQFAPTPVADLTDEEVDLHLRAMRAHIDLCRAAVPVLAGGGTGRIVLVSGALATRALPGCALYSAAKAGLHAFHRGLALEVGRAGITVNAVAPGRVDPQDERPPTDAHAQWQQLEGDPQDRRAFPDPPTADQVAAAIDVFVGPGAGALTGQVLYLAQGEVMA
ncbi:MAG TPA: SDR family oxidoreductase [Cellulomonas sp.]